MTRRVFTFVLCAFLCTTSFVLGGCVDQYPEKTSGKKVITGTEHVIATSRAVAEIMSRLNVDVIAVPQSELEASDRFEGAANIGASMNPDMEIIRSLQSDWVFSPKSLEGSLRPRFEASRIDVAFLNLRSIDNMYSSIEKLGPLLKREKEAQECISQYADFRTQYKEEKVFETPPRVLILMGLPGSYLVASEKSYVGSMVAMTGAVNVYKDVGSEFITANTEDMLSKDPDLILRATHALPDEVLEMFDDEFRENDIWKHFSAVERGNVFDLPSDQFGMSASFEYPFALDSLRNIYKKMR